MKSARSSTSHRLECPGKKQLLTELDLKALSDAFRDMGENNERGLVIVILGEIKRGGAGLFLRREPRSNGRRKQRPAAQLSRN